MSATGADPGHRHHGDDHHHHDHRDGHRHGPWGTLRRLFGRHSHDAADQVDAELEGSAEGLRALWWSLLVLGATAALQGLVVLASHSVALLGDTLHNLGDALTAVPLGVAFVVGRRPANDRYTYGYGRAEDLAGLAVVAVVVASALVAGWEAIHRLLHPAPVDHLPWVAAAAVIGFAGNEIAAQIRIRTGHRIGSAALVADGVHARADGVTSLAVLLGVAGVAIGWAWADAVVGLFITVAIVAIARGAVRSVWHRLMDAVDPGLVASSIAAVRDVPGVIDVDRLRIRWIGHQLHAEAEVTIAAELSVVEGHTIAHHVERHLLRAVPRLTDAVVHVSPDPDGQPDAHDAVAHHHETPGAHEHPD